MTTLPEVVVYIEAESKAAAARGEETYHVNVYEIADHFAISIKEASELLRAYLAIAHLAPKSKTV